MAAIIVTKNGVTGIPSGLANGELAVDRVAGQLWVGNGGVSKPIIGVGIDDNATSTAVTIDASENVGVGTVTPGLPLVVEGDSFLGLEGVTGLGVGALFGTTLLWARNGALTSVNTPISLLGSTAAITADTYIGLNAGGVQGLRITSAGDIGIGTTTPTEKLDVDGNAIRVRDSSTVASATAVGAVGEIRWDASYVYVCVATNTWKRTALTTW